MFVAGATGQAGVRIAQTLLRQGFSVRAGVPELGSAQELARLAAKYKVGFFSLISMGYILKKIFFYFFISFLFFDFFIY